MLGLYSSSLTGGLPYPEVLGQFRDLYPTALFLGALDGVTWVDRITGRRWYPLATAPSVITSGSTQVVRFAGGGALGANDGLDTFASLTQYSVVSIARLAASGSGGVMTSNDVGPAKLIEFFDAGSGNVSAQSQFDSGSGAVNGGSGFKDATWHMHILSVDATVLSNRMLDDKDSAGAESNSDMTLSAASGGRRLLIGGAQSAGFLPFNGDLALQMVLPYAIHRDATVLAKAVAACAAYKAML